MVFTKKEVMHFIVAVLVLGVVFGFNDQQAIFNPQHWLANLLLVMATSALLLFIYVIMQKCAAAHYGAETEFQVWSLQQFWFKRQHKVKQGIPLGVILPLIITVISLGRIPFATVASSELSTSERLRFGKKFREPADFEAALMLAAGPLTLVLLAVLMPLFDSSQFALLVKRIGISLAVAQMLPLPNTEGMKIFTSSSALYIFSIAFILAGAFLAFAVNSVLVLLIASLIAAALLFCYWFFVIFK